MWDHDTPTLRAVVDFEVAGPGDSNYDFRYLPAQASSVEFLLAVTCGYEQDSGRNVDLARVMAWHVRTALGDALRRTEARAGLPGGGTASAWVDELADRLTALASSPGGSGVSYWEG